MPRVLSARFGRLQLPMRAFVFLLQHHGTRNLMLQFAESIGARWDSHSGSTSPFCIPCSRYLFDLHNGSIHVGGQYIRGLEGLHTHPDDRLSTRVPIVHTAYSCHVDTTP